MRGRCQRTSALSASMHRLLVSCVHLTSKPMWCLILELAERLDCLFSLQAPHGLFPSCRNIVMPAMSCLSVTLPPTAGRSGGAQHAAQQPELVTVEAIVDTIDVMASLQKPKKVGAVASLGRRAGSVGNSQVQVDRHTRSGCQGTAGAFLRPVPRDHPACWHARERC